MSISENSFQLRLSGKCIFVALITLHLSKLSLQYICLISHVIAWSSSQQVNVCILIFYLAQTLFTGEEDMLKSSASFYFCFTDCTSELVH